MLLPPLVPVSSSMNSKQWSHQSSHREPAFVRLSLGERITDILMLFWSQVYTLKSVKISLIIGQDVKCQALQMARLGNGVLSCMVVKKTKKHLG